MSHESIYFQQQQIDWQNKHVPAQADQELDEILTILAAKYSSTVFLRLPVKQPSAAASSGDRDRCPAEMTQSGHKPTAI